MTPREREAWLAEHLLEWTEVATSENGTVLGTSPGGVRQVLDLRSWAGFGLVVDTMEKQGWEAAWASDFARMPNQRYRATFDRPEARGVGMEYAATAWEAVQVAAIRALGGEP